MCSRNYVCINNLDIRTTDMLYSIWKTKYTEIIRPEKKSSLHLPITSRIFDHLNFPISLWSLNVCISKHRIKKSWLWCIWICVSLSMTTCHICVQFTLYIGRFRWNSVAFLMIFKWKLCLGFFPLHNRYHITC